MLTVKDNKKKGYILLYRSIRDNEFLHDCETPFHKEHAYIRMLMRVNHEPKTASDGTRIERGQFYTSAESLAEEWRWGVKKVRNFLSGAEKNGMITVDRKQHGIIVSICNYEDYKDAEGEPRIADGKSENDLRIAEGKSEMASLTHSCTKKGKTRIAKGKSTRIAQGTQRNNNNTNQDIITKQEKRNKKAAPLFSSRGEELE